VVAQGRQAIVHQANQLPARHPTLGYTPWTSTHLHGSASLPQYDGYASDVTNPGQFKDYRYPNFQNARTMWYHDHGNGVHFTAPNAYMGLAAMYILHDESELSLPIPHGRYDLPLVVKDAMFTDTGALIFDDHGASGLFGDVVLVDGRPWPKLEVERRKYRFRFLNASISRSYDIALDTGGPMTVIGGDGGLYPAPQTVTSFRHGMAERYEVVIDFADYAIGQRVVLKNRGLPNSTDFDTTGDIMAVDVVAEASDTENNEIPDELFPDNEVMQLQESDAVATRRLEFVRKNGMWTVNGLTWEDVINSGFRDVVANPGLNDVDIWEFRNKSGGWFHPIHVHQVDFKILDRNGRPPFAYEQGPKDTVYLGESETVRIIARFGANRAGT